MARELSSQGFRLVSGGTDNHLVLVDLTKTDLTGKDAQVALEEAGILANRNAIPFDTKPPQITSGLRLGTPAMTTRGFGPEEIVKTVALITRVLSDPNNNKLLKQTREEVAQMCLRFPAPGID